MDNTSGIIIAMGIGLGIVIIFGIYKLATSSLHEKSVFKPGTTDSNNRQALKTVITIFLSILVFLALYVTYQIFMSQNSQ